MSNNLAWCPVLKIVNTDVLKRKYLVHYEGRAKRFDEWVDIDQVVGAVEQVSKRCSRKSSIVSSHLSGVYETCNW